MLFSELIKQALGVYLADWKLVRVSRKGNFVYELFYDETRYTGSYDYPYGSGTRRMWYYWVVVSRSGQVLQKKLIGEDDYDF